MTTQRNHLFQNQLTRPDIRLGIKAGLKHGVRQGISLALSAGLLLGGILPAFSAGSGVLTGDVRVTVNPANIKATLPVPGGERKVTMALHGISIQDALRALGKKGGFNVLIDESVTGDLSVDLHDVTIQDALETIRAYGGLAYSLQGKNLMVAAADSEKGQSFQKSATRIFHLKNANAQVVATILNSSLFADRIGNTGSSGGASSGGTSMTGGVGNPVTPDFHTNSLIVVGSPKDIKAVEEHLEVLDKPRESKTWRLSHANVLDVATILASSLFNEGIPALNASSSGGSSSSSSSSSGPVGSMQAQIRVVADNVQEGAGTSQSTQSGGSGGGGSSGGSDSINNSVTLRSRVKAVQTISVSPTGPIILPDTRLNTLTLMGTAEQIAMAEALIPTLDRKVPQVVLETALIEVSETGQKELGFNFGFNNGGASFGSNNPSTVGLPTNASTPLENVMQWSTSPLHRTRNFYYQINALITQNKAKMLANPTVITSNDNEAIVSIVDEIVRSVTLTRSALTAPTATVNIGEAGIVLNLLPRIGADNTINLRVRPVISTVADTRTGLGGIITLLSKREVLTQNVRLQDGETFVLGGLVQNTNKEAVSRTPGLSGLPILGALARNSTLSKKRTELVVLITPHIINDESELTGGIPGKGSPGMTPATYLGQASHGSTLPVSYTDADSSLKSSLPPLGQPHVINSLSSGQDPLDNRDMAQHAPRPSGSLLPDEMVSAPKSAKAQPKPSGSIIPVSYRSSSSQDRPASNHTIVRPPAPLDTSDAAIRAIMEKFK